MANRKKPNRITRHMKSEWMATALLIYELIRTEASTNGVLHGLVTEY